MLVYNIFNIYNTFINQYAQYEHRNKDFCIPGCNAFFTHRLGTGVTDTPTPSTFTIEIPIPKSRIVTLCGDLSVKSDALLTTQY